jgi:cation diffusion facilitator CzcD-associated flavoprotein CzcO
MDSADAIVVGAGPAGLACAACMKQLGLAVSMLDKADAVASVWRRHYDRLHLHSHRDHSALPGKPMPRSYPKYPARAQVVEYLESYAKHFDLHPTLSSTVKAIRRDGFGWRVEQVDRSSSAPIVVVATGWADFPNVPTWSGSDMYQGKIVHSSNYRNPVPYLGKRVLVVGFGNSAAEIALDLAEAKVDVTLAVRGPVQIVPRDLLGVSIVSWAILESGLPARLADALNAPAIRLAVGPTKNLGLKLSEKGPLRMIKEDKRVPLLDAGALASIRDGSIKVRGGVDRFTSDGVAFLESAPEKFDRVVLATGYRPDLHSLVPEVQGVLDSHGLPIVTGRATLAPGLFFCGLIASPTGQLREIGIEAQRIAQLARNQLARG